MDQTQQHPPMSGNDELAKALDGGLQFEETPVPGTERMPSMAGPSAASPATPGITTPTSSPPTLSTTPPLPDEPPMPSLDPAAKAEPAEEPPKAPTIEHPHANKSHADSPVKSKAEPKAEGLDKLKASALEELRPLVGKLKLPAEEKFDTLLLIIRSTDDQNLLDEAHAAAKEIGDETRRAQALLDVIKEIDYFSSKR